MNEKEKRLTLELCKFQDKDKSALISLIKEGHATPSVLGELFFNRTAGIAYGVLKDAELIGAVNREFANSLRNAYIQNIERNKSFSECLKYVSEILMGASDSYVMLKGAYLCFAYPKGYRTSNDIDLLVNPEKITDIEKLLSSNGFIQGNIRNGNFTPAKRREIIESRMSRGETVPFVKEVNLPFMKYLEIDINFSLGSYSDDGKAVRDMIASARTFKIDDFYIRIPSEKHFFIHLCSHLWKEASVYPWIKMKRDMSLYKYCDIYMMANGLSTDIAEGIAECAKEYGAEKDCFCSVAQTAELLCENNFAYRVFAEKFGVDEGAKDIVISPSEKKIYKYEEKSAVKRLFSSNRLKLLKEAGVWIP
ncbi:MAG: nucleotidyltransferase family protein [Clostridia bacterium]|nr:nucleotidyltransferase family protein [Clostridia bacterium]